MSNSPASKTFTEALEQAKKKEHRRLWAFAAIWVGGALVLFALLWFFRSELNHLQDTTRMLQGSLIELEVREKNLSASTKELAVEVQEATRAADKSLRALKATNEKLNQIGVTLESATRDTEQKVKVVRTMLDMLDQKYEKVSTKASMVEGALTDVQAQIKSSNERVTDVSGRLDETKRVLEGAQEQLAEANKDLERLAEDAKKLVEKIQNIERELKTFHYVFTTNTWNRLWGTNIYVGLGDWRKEPTAGVKDFCVSEEKKGQCLNGGGGPQFLPLGSEVYVSVGEYKYRITARYGISIRLAHDQVGFDVNEEKLIK